MVNGILAHNDKEYFSNAFQFSRAYVTFILFINQWIKPMILNIFNRLLQKVGFKIIRNSEPDSAELLYYQHDYGKSGYAAYQKAQVDANKAKINHVWAEERTLGAIADYIERHPVKKRSGVCHGARNGWEVKWLKDRLSCPVIGTDISETALEMDDMVQHDFHEIRQDWLGKFSFIYSNSLDQAFSPEKALAAWSDQISDDGLIFIEHTMYHAPQGASSMDPFGAHPMIMPYLFFQWGRGSYELADILKLADVEMGNKGVVASKGAVWIFILRKSEKV